MKAHELKKRIEYIRTVYAVIMPINEQHTYMDLKKDLKAMDICVKLIDDIGRREGFDTDIYPH